MVMPAANHPWFFIVPNYVSNLIKILTHISQCFITIYVFVFIVISKKRFLLVRHKIKAHNYSNKVQSNSKKCNIFGTARMNLTIQFK